MEALNRSTFTPVFQEQYLQSILTRVPDAVAVCLSILAVLQLHLHMQTYFCTDVGCPHTSLHPVAVSITQFLS